MEILTWKKKRKYILLVFNMLDLLVNIHLKNCMIIQLLTEDARSFFKFACAYGFCISEALINSIIS